MSGRTVLHGWIDNATHLARILSSETNKPAAVYDAAIERWGDRADAEIHGHYAALTVMPDGSIRLARSPWAAPPLNILTHDGGISISSLPSAFRALGASLEIDHDAIVDQLSLDTGNPAPGSSFCDVRRVRIGTIVHLDGAKIREIAWYDPETIPSAAEITDGERIARCETLLRRAAEAALAHAENPAIALSGGLDSSIVAHELLAARPSRSLASITMVPDAQWSGADVPGTIGNEWPLVERFAAQHPLLRPVRADPVHGGFDYRYREIARLAGTFNAAQSLLGPHHAIWQAAKDGRHDWLLTADLGNQSFSDDGRWAYAEGFRHGKWRQLARLIRTRKDDSRPSWRKFAVLSLLPQLPSHWRAQLQKWFRGGAARLLAQGTVLTKPAREAYMARATGRNSRPAWQGYAHPRSRRDAVRRDWQAQCGETAEITLALELFYGVRYRDVTAYRPLIEYCLSLPTGMFARDGETRWLAKRLASGRMPREQAAEDWHGLHHVDWLVRLRRDAPRFIEQVEAMRDHPWLAETLDLDRMHTLLANLPDEESEDFFEALAYVQGVARAIAAGQWVGLNEGRNDF